MANLGKSNPNLFAFLLLHRVRQIQVEADVDGAVLVRGWGRVDLVAEDVNCGCFCRLTLVRGVASSKQVRGPQHMLTIANVNQDTEIILK